MPCDAEVKGRKLTSPCVPLLVCILRPGDRTGCGKCGGRRSCAAVKSDRGDRHRFRCIHPLWVRGKTVLYGTIMLVLGIPVYIWRRRRGGQAHPEVTESA